MISFCIYKWLCYFIPELGKNRKIFFSTKEVMENAQYLPHYCLAAHETSVLSDQWRPV